MGWQEAIATTVGGLGYELVDVERAQRGLLRVTIDRIPGRRYRVDRVHESQPAVSAEIQAEGQPQAQADASAFVTVEDCEAVTRQLRYVLEVEGLDYARLEVSSPGLDRPLKREADYQRFAGQAVRVALKQPFDGRKVWEGVLAAAESGGWSLTIKNGKTEQVLGFTLSEVRDARLVPVLNFKGRQTGTSPVGGADKAAAPAAAAPASDGGW
ncbi:MAG: ribosome maturation factor RimP [Rubrivivax sp.]|nr:ribosome maturation factor RimP [Rubrivivax sp.]